MAGARIFDTNTLDWTPHNRFPEISVKVLETRATHPWASMMLVQLEVGGVIQAHIHETETETAYVLAGQALLSHGDDETTLTAGMGASITPGTLHGIRNTGEAPLELLAIHMPPVR